MSARLLRKEIKPGWQRRRLGHLLRFGNGKETTEVEAADGAYPVYGSGGEFKRANGYLYDGPSILFGRKGTLDKPLLVNGRFWTVDTMFYTVPGPEVEPRFVHYWALTVPFHILSTDTAVPSMTSTDLGQLYVDLPPLETQRAIADYLDRETAEVDAMSADLDELEALLTERRGSIIRTHVLPTEGEYTRVKLVANVSLGKTVQSVQKRPDEVQRNYVRAAHIQPHGRLVLDEKTMWFTPQELKQLTLRRNDVLVVEGGAGYGRSVVLSEDMPDWGFQNHVIRVRPNAGIVGEFVHYTLLAHYSAGLIDLLVDGATIPALSSDKARELPILVVDTAEQRRIAAEIDRETAEIDSMLADIAQLRDLLAERRAAVIAAAVTGQIDVPTTQETEHA